MAEVTSVLTVQGKSGPREYHITHPDNLTDDQLKAVAQDYLSKAEPEMQYPSADIRRRPESFSQGFLEGAEKPINNAARALEAGLDKIGLADPANRLGEALGLAPSVEAAEQAQQEYNQSQPVVASPLGKFAGETAALLPTAAIPGGPIVQGAAGGALLTDSRTPAE